MVFKRQFINLRFRVFYGETAIKLTKLSIDTKFSLFGYDQNKKMIELAKKKIKKIKKRKNFNTV